MSKSQVRRLTWQNNCNVKFKVWFGSGAEASKRKPLSFRASNPTLDGGFFSKELTPDQWVAIRQLVRDVSGSRINWYVESWDSLNRKTTTGLTSFERTD